MTQNGKGDKPRPIFVDSKTWENNWNKIFKSKKKKMAILKGSIANVVTHATPIRAVCLSECENKTEYSPVIGETYYFSEGCEVVWLQKIRLDDIIIRPTCCRKCGKELVHDQLSDKFGDYCPNEWCNEYV